MPRRTVHDTIIVLLSAIILLWLAVTSVQSLYASSLDHNVKERFSPSGQLEDGTIDPLHSTSKFGDTYDHANGTELLARGEESGEEWGDEGEVLLLQGLSQVLRERSPDDPPEDLTYDKAKAKGEDLLCLLQASADTVAQSKWTNAQQLDWYGWTTKPPKPLNPFHASRLISADVFEGLGPATDDADNLRVENNHDTNVRVDKRNWRKTDAIYENYFSTGGQNTAIFASQNWSPDFWGSLNDPPVTGDNVIPLKRWSDVIFLNYQSLMVGRGKDAMHRLKYIFRMRVNNKKSVKIMEGILGGGSLRESIKAWPGVYYGMETDDGRALLGTPNGLGVAWLLIQHKKQLGRKTVAGVRLYRNKDDNLASLCFYLKDVPLHPPELPPEEPKDSEEYQPDERGLVPGAAVGPRAPLTFDDAVTQGEWYLCLLYAPLNTVFQSTHTDWDDLEANGWTLIGNYAYTPYAPINAMVNIFKALDLPTAQSSYRRMSIYQDEEVEIHKRVYQPTDSHYQNYFNVGPKEAAIVASENYSPAYCGAKRNPSITGKDLVPLKQWSDVVFLKYQHLMEEYAEEGAMKRLKYVFRIHITHDTTRAVIDKVLGGDQLAVWPGKYFDMSTREGKALLGTPHGFGPSWLLVQHKEQLGRKVVVGVTVFTDKPGPQPIQCLCFHFADWEEGMKAP